MGYFSETDIQALLGDDTAAKAATKQRFLDLHKKIHEQLQQNDITLELVKVRDEAVQNVTVSQEGEDQVLTIHYMRSRSNAASIERLMGREEVASVNNIITRLHPVIELRLSEAGLAIEFIMSPDAWWDQQNLKGKLSIVRHRHEFYSMLKALEGDYCMGFWQGIRLSEMHLTGKFFQHPRILDEWLSTFHPNADWFRLGIWYEIDAEQMTEDAILDEVVNQIQILFPIYAYFLWASDNNFREFVVGNS